MHCLRLSGKQLVPLGWVEVVSACAPGVGNAVFLETPMQDLLKGNTDLDMLNTEDVHDTIPPKSAMLEHRFAESRFQLAGWTNTRQIPLDGLAADDS
ncbi:hypothetical protein DIZ76_013390 [Coccidioides immitis]|nr:hypothetical protein DIZ76_013390 [Coccidioides immitis]